MQTQLSLLGEADVKAEKPVPPTTVRLGHRAAEVPLWKKRREALEDLMAVLSELEGKDLYIGTYGGANNHFWLNHLKLGRMKVDTLPRADGLPSVIFLWGSRESSVSIFTDQVVNFRRQEYQGLTLWLLDFWNGFGEYPIDPYRPRGYVSLQIVRFKD